MAGRVESVLGRIVNSIGAKNRMDTVFVELGLDIVGSDVAAVTGVAVLLFDREGKKARFGPGSVGGVTILAGIANDGPVVSMRPWVDACAVPGFD